MALERSFPIEFIIAGTPVSLQTKRAEALLVQKFELEKIFAFAAPSPILARAIAGPKPLLYVQLSDDPTEELG